MPTIPKSASSDENKILRVTEPDRGVLNPVTLEVLDYEKTSEDQTAIKTDKFMQKYPLVEIGKYRFGQEEIEYFKLECVGYVPEVTILIEDNHNYFNNLLFPKDGDLISVRIASQSEQNYKSVRVDFDILDIQPIGGSTMFNIKGKMHIPYDTNEICLAYPELTSYDTLLQVSEDLALGFASNETTTKDSMTWLNAFESNLEFLNEVTLHSYKNDESFYTSFIDVHYYFNFVNVNNQFTTQEGTDTTLVEYARVMEKEVDDNQEVTASTPFMLTNHVNFKGTSNYIIEYIGFNKSGDVVRKNGYKRYVQFFDKEMYEYQSQFVDPLTTEGTENDRVLPKGRVGTDMQDWYNKYKWLGTQDNFNSHENYLYSYIHNVQNNQEIKKLGMKVTIPAGNFHLQRYQVIPVLIFDTNERRQDALRVRDGEVGEEDPKSERQGERGGGRPMVNKILTGHYVVGDITYVYRKDDPNVSMECTLYRREYPIQKRKD